ncbi:MAG: O-antigen ligase domain-containing protein, partial [Thermomicrobium sp.]|nr:O-antigen ligase domain-containing protein [Thermomicrobium sp.]
MRTIELPVWPSAEQLRVPPRVAVFLGSIAAAVGAAGLAAVLVFLGPVPALATLVALVAGTLIAVDARAGLWVVLAIVALLPYAVIPVKVVVTPAISSIASLALLTVWLVRLFLDRAMTVPLHPLVLVVVLFAFVTSFAFVLGIGRGYTSQVYHDYGKFLLSLALFFVVWSSLRTLADYRRLTVALLLVASAAALVALVLYLG